MTEELQLAHHQITNDSHGKSIVLVLNHVQSPQNIGLIIRTAEAMGVQKIFVISEQFSELTPKIKRLTRSTEKIYFYRIFYGNNTRYSIIEKSELAFLL